MVLCQISSPADVQIYPESHARAHHFSTIESTYSSADSDSNAAHSSPYQVSQR